VLDFFTPQPLGMRAWIRAEDLGESSSLGQSFEIVKVSGRIGAAGSSFRRLARYLDIPGSNQGNATFGWIIKGDMAI
jgi:hypothetical protein